MAKLHNIPNIIWMFYGILLYEIAGLMSLFFAWSNYLCMLGVIVSLLAFFKAPKVSLPASARTSLTFLYLTITFMALRGSIIGNTPHLYGEGPLPSCSMYDIIRYFLVNPYSALAIFSPMVVLVDWHMSEFRYFGSIAILSAFISLFAIWIFKDFIASADTYGQTSFSTMSGFISIRRLSNQLFVGLGLILSFCWAFQYKFKDKLYWVLLIVLFLNFYVTVLGGGRGDSVTAFGYIVFFFYFFKKSLKSGYVDKGMVRILFTILSFSFVFILYFLVTKTSFLDLLISRTFEGGDTSAGLRESTREEFVNAMIRDFNNDFKSWIIGRGVNGCYSLGGSILRSSLEWGYMWLILKGGVIYLVLYVYILIKAFANGYRKSKNALARSLGFLCLVQVLLLVPFGLPTVSIQCLLVWHSVRLLNSPAFLNLSDSEVHRLINDK